MKTLLLAAKKAAPKKKAAKKSVPKKKSAPKRKGGTWGGGAGRVSN